MAIIVFMQQKVPVLVMLFEFQHHSGKVKLGQCLIKEAIINICDYLLPNV